MVLPPRMSAEERADQMRQQAEQKAMQAGGEHHLF